MKLENYVVGIIIATLCITAMYAVSNQNSGFWDMHDYTPPTNNISYFDRVDELNDDAQEIADDLLALSSGGITDLISRMVKGAYASIRTLFQSFTLPLELITFFFLELGVPSVIITGLYTVLLMSFVFAVIYLIFIRSDNP